MIIFAAKNAKGANNVQKIFFDGLMRMSGKIVFLNKSFSSRSFAFFAAKRVCLS
jgi:hypothetical protein